MSRTRVVYKDLAVGADADAAVSAPTAMAFSRLNQLPFGLRPEPCITLEPNAWKLDGTRVPLVTQQVAFWSRAQSGQDGTFQTAPVITINFDQKYTSTGIYLVFDEATGEYCPEIRVEWYQDNVLKAGQVFHPDGTRYFCEQQVVAYNRVVLSVLRTSKAYRWAKINGIFFGMIREFGPADLLEARITAETSLTGEGLPASNFQWSLRSPKRDSDYLFQLKQPVEAWTDNALIGVYYITSAKYGGQAYKIACTDIVGVLDESDYPGGNYIEGTSAQALLLDIVGGMAPVDIEIPDRTLYGVLEPSSRREAIQQVLIAWGGIAVTTRSRGLRIIPAAKTANCQIGLDRVFPTPTVETSTLVTEVQVTAHQYRVSGDGYADSPSVVSIKNPNASASNKANVISLTGATLVSSHNAQAVAQRLYDCYMAKDTIKAKAQWEGAESLGDLAVIMVAPDDTTVGHIEKMEITLSNTVVAKITARGEAKGGAV